MTEKNEKNIYMAKLADQCGRYKDMSQYLEDLNNQKEKGLNSDERNLLSDAYKNLINSPRTALRTILAYESKEKKKDNSQYLPYIIEYKQKLINELTKLCRETIKTIDDKLLKKAEDDNAKLFYLRMKGDYNRYIAEFAEGDLKKQVSDEANKAYNEAVEVVKSMSALNPIALGLALSYSVFYYEIYNEHKKAIEIAEAAIEKAEKELPDIDEDSEENRETVSIYNLLKENLDIWLNEEEGDQ